METSVCFVGHGSRDQDATREFLELIDMFRGRRPSRIVEYGFLEFARPVIQDGLDRCVERGAKSIVVLPGMLMAAGHAKNDIPSEIREARRRHPGVDFRYGRHLHLHPKILELCGRRIEEAEARAAPGDRKDTLLLVVGRGSSDPDSNSDIQKLTRILWEGLGFGWGATCFSGVAEPLVPEALERCHRMGYSRIVVFPFFLFTGILEKRVRRQTEEFAARHPETEFLSSDYLKPDPLLGDAFMDRAEEAVLGSPNMNCELCKYRVQIPGYETAVGSPQVGHHHHVRGIGQDDGDPHEYDHHHHHASGDHGHGH